MRTSGIALRLEGLTKGFGPVKAVDCVSLEIERGEFLTLLGPSGSGKTTTLSLVAGFENPDSGEIYLDEKRLSGVPPHKRRIGVVFQNYALFPHLTVFENVAFALRILRWPNREVTKRVSELLSLVRLEGMQDRLPAQLSGGQQQRVALARALAFSPSVLLLDEPLGALDRKLREHMLMEFRRIHKTLRTTMIYVTHDQEEALVMSDRVAVMNHGKLARVGTPEELYENPVDPFVADFLGDTNIFTGTVLDSNRIGIGKGGWSIVVPQQLSVGTQVRVVVRPEKITIGDAPNGWNSIRGHIEEVIYLGEATKYRVRTAADQLVSVKQLNCQLVPIRAARADVTVSWHPADCRVVEDAK